MEWLLSPIDAARPHDLDLLLAWHGRLMVLAWGILLPSGVLVARFFKVAPHQNWPQELDNQLWWYGHQGLQYAGGIVMLAGLSLVLYQVQQRGGLWFDFKEYGIHQMLGWSIIVSVTLQFLSGWLRGSKGGPGETPVRGDHYDMTRRRIIFEYFHKMLGYILLLLSVLTVLTGLWKANGPVWMWLVLITWWLCLLIIFMVLQRQNRALDTYQAIWGPDKQHPGNHLKPIGWGIRRRQANR